MENKEKIIKGIKLLDDNKLKLAHTLCEELSKIGIPYLINEDNYPIVTKDNVATSIEIYNSICSKFLQNNNK